MDVRDVAIAELLSRMNATIFGDLLAVASVECEFEANRRAFGSGPTGLGWRSSASCSPSVVEQLWPADVLGQGLWTITMSRTTG